MFRKASGVKAQYGPFTLLLASDFDEWRIFLLRPGTTINGGRQFTEDKAKENAVLIADRFFSEKGEDPPQSEVEWTPLGDDDWLNWHG